MGAAPPDETAAARLRSLARSLGRAGRFVLAVAQRFYADACLQHASALAYVTLLSLVPLLALMFAVLKGLGVQRRLEPLLLSRVALDHETVDQIVSFVDRTNVTTLGALGAAALVLTVISVLGSVEATLNHIWVVHRRRSPWRQATDYLSVVLITPFLLLAGVAITSSVQEQALLRWVFQVEYVGDALLRSLKLLPIAINAVALAVLYAVMPNRRPRFVSLALGAVAAGLAWQIVQAAYVTLQIGVARYSAIYGALAQLPVTLVWLYVSWVIVLAGAEVAAVHEFGVEAAGEPRGTISTLAVALHVLVRATERFRGRGGAVNVAALAGELQVSVETAGDVARALEAGGMLTAVGDGTSDYLLARDPADIPLADLERALERATIPRGCDPRVRRFVASLPAGVSGTCGERRLADLLDPPVDTVRLQDRADAAELKRRVDIEET